MISIIYDIKQFAKKNFVNIIVVSLFMAFGAIQLSQNIAIGVLYRSITENTDRMNTIHKENIDRLGEFSLNLINTIEKYDKNQSESLRVLEDKTQARIDIIDSAIEPEHKRRMLVVKIRDAITENTDTKLSIRDLNNISVAVIDYSYQYNIPIYKVLAQIKQESDFNIKAKSRAGALGLMQIMPETMKYIEYKEGKRLDAWNIYNNIRAGCSYMAEQLEEFGDYTHALQAYNVGPTTVQRYLAKEINSLPRETINYPIFINHWSLIFAKYGLD